MNNLIIETLSKNDSQSIKYLLENFEDNFECNWTSGELKQFIISNNYITYIAKKENIVVGFLVISCIYNTIDILNIAINVNYRRMKIATRLLQNIINNPTNTNVILEVNINNYPAINLYKNLGFKIVSIRKGYYLNKKTNTKEDAYIMKI